MVEEHLSVPRLVDPALPKAGRLSFHLLSTSLTRLYKFRIHWLLSHVAGLIAFQTLDSDTLVPLSADMNDLIHTLSDLSIQAYQQLLSITETRLQNIIGTAKSDDWRSPLLCSSYLFSNPPLPQSLPCWRAKPSKVYQAQRWSWQWAGSGPAQTPGL